MKFCFVFGFLFVLVSSLFCSPPEPDGQKRVLIINSYHKGYKWTDAINQGIVGELEKCDVNCNIYTEYMDTKRIFNEEYDRLLLSLFKEKYRHISFDVIICTDDNAFNFLKLHKNQLFGPAPVVFCGVNYVTEEELAGFDQVTGVNEAIDLISGVDLIISLHREVKKIAVIIDNTITGQKVKKTFLEKNGTGYKGVEFIFFENPSMEELLQNLAVLENDTAVLYTIFFRDSLDHFYEYNQSIPLIASACKVPLYGTSDFSLGYGIIGGYLSNSFFPGEQTAKMAIRILKGEDISSIPVIYKNPGQFMFDHKVLKKYNISKSQLPGGSVIINEPRTFADYYRENRIFILTLLLISTSIILFILICSTINISRSRKKIWLSEKKYKAIFENTGSATVIIEDDTTIISLANSHFEDLSGFPKEQVEGIKSWTDFVLPDHLDRMKKFHKARRKEPDRVPKNFEFTFIDREKTKKNVLSVVDTIPGTSKSIASMVDITRRTEAEKKIEEMARTDALTGIYNRRAFVDLAVREYHRTLRNHKIFSVVFTDIDFFKQINDTYGHSAGDQVLTAITAKLKESLRKTDIFARYGGDEFIILMAETKMEGARMICERLRQAVQTVAITDFKKPIKITLSIGIAEVDLERHLSLEDVIRCADKALYHSKEMGRDRISFYSKENEIN